MNLKQATFASNLLKIYAPTKDAESDAQIRDALNKALKRRKKGKK